MKTSYPFSRRGPDRLAEEIATVLSGKAAFEFKALFSIVHASLKANNRANGGEEMLRLRAYEKLQTMVQAGVATRNGKEYRGSAKGLAAFFKEAREQQEKTNGAKNAKASSDSALAQSPAI